MSADELPATMTEPTDFGDSDEPGPDADITAITDMIAAEARRVTAECRDALDQLDMIAVLFDSDPVAASSLRAQVVRIRDVLKIRE